MNNASQYICCNCKAPLFFDPPSQKWKCHHCFSCFNENEINSTSNESLFDDTNTTTTETNEISTEENLTSYKCSNCGAEIITDENTSATFCIYCKSPAIIKNRFTGQFKPKYILPFSLTKDEVEKIYTDWISTKKFAPDDFQSESEIKKISGLYVPYGLFDADVKCSLKGKGTTVRKWTSGNYRYTETSYFNFEREGFISYNKVPIDGLIKIDNDKVERIEPFNYSKIKDFSMSYLAGFLAEKYDVPSNEAEKVAKTRIKQYTDRALKETVLQYNRTYSTTDSFNILNISNDYALLPVYILVNQYNGESYEFLVNGQTGKISGTTPIIPAKVCKYFFKTYLKILLVWIIIAAIGGVFFV